MIDEKLREICNSIYDSQGWISSHIQKADFSTQQERQEYLDKCFENAISQIKAFFVESFDGREIEGILRGSILYKEAKTSKVDRDICVRDDTQAIIAEMKRRFK